MRMGEMERDAQIGHGAAELTIERDAQLDMSLSDWTMPHHYMHYHSQPARLGLIDTSMGIIDTIGSPDDDDEMMMMMMIMNDNDDVVAERHHLMIRQGLVLDKKQHQSATTFADIRTLPRVFGAEVAARECCVCLSEATAVVAFDCGHLCACRECSLKVRQCPLCRQHISRRFMAADADSADAASEDASASPLLTQAAAT